MPEQRVKPQNPEIPSISSPEHPASPEVSPERPAEPEWKPDFLEEETAAEQPAVSPVAPTPVAPAPPPTSLFVKEVEHVLSEGLEQTYQKLDGATRSKFKEVGETTAKSVAGLLDQTKVQSKKILDLIVAWLKIIPGVNTFFLEQEAKIKTDKLLALRRPHKTQ